MVAKRSRWHVREPESRLPDLQSPDEETRGKAVRGFCPCYAGWEAFEAHVGEVLRAMRDPSRAVRAQALHVFDDATRMCSEADLNYYREDGEERIGEKRAQRYRSIEQRLEARRDNRMRRRRKRHHGRA
ncbi:MAG TPA: hypothetical protein VF297_03750 [Pyrinomonadaceae bacterium]